jgi:hypothetical protein
MNHQHFFFNVVLLAFVSLSEAESPEECKAKILKDGFPDGFHRMIAHGIHSLTVEDLKMFNPLVNKTNRVPTVNTDLLSDEPLLRSAPSVEVLSGRTFNTEGMRLIDRMMSTMDRKHYALDALETVIHALHMSDCWHMALTQYKKMVENNAPKEICPCLLDIDNNGITYALRAVALELREPKLIFKTHIDDKVDRFMLWLYFEKYEGVLRSEKSGLNLPDLTSTEDWAVWRKNLLFMTPEDAHTLAYFLYCSL